MTHTRHRLASDNYSGVHPVIMDAIVRANVGHAPAYIGDEYSCLMADHIKRLFGKQATGYAVFNGTGANVLGLSALLPRYGAVIATDTAHINTDESVAPQYVAGIKILSAPHQQGKLTPNAITALIDKSLHRPQAAVVYISQATELGTCYSLDELCEIRQVCDELGLFLYIDGARLCNAAAHLGCTLYDIAKYADILSLGGTKNGLMLGECLVVMNPAFHQGMEFLRKTHMQLASKMRFMSAQFNAWFSDDLYMDLARHSNAMASYLYKEIKDLNPITYPVQSNAVFARLPNQAVIDRLDKFGFYVWTKDDFGVRLMTSFDTTVKDIDAFVFALKEAL